MERRMAQSKHWSGFYAQLSTVGNKMHTFCDTAKMTFEALLGPDVCHEYSQKNHIFWKAC